MGLTRYYANTASIDPNNNQRKHVQTMIKNKALLAGFNARPAPALWPALACAALMGIASAASAASAPALQPSLSLRPLDAGEISAYKLTGGEVSAGLKNVPIGEPAYLEVLVNAALPLSQITNVTWTLTSTPIGSAAALAPSPLGTNVPPYNPADIMNQAGAAVYQVGARQMLRPDLEGPYTVSVTLQTTGSGSTNMNITIIGASYLGISACKLCHSGGQGGATNIYSSWSQTEHATFFTLAINGQESSHYGASCISCHTVGYDTNTNAVNGGFDDVAKSLGWTFPAVLSPTNWASMPAALQNLGNIQCENCHGPASQHARNLGDTNLITKTYNYGDCAQCHNEPNTHIKAAEWKNSLHARVTRTPSGAGREACARCHTAGGFAGYTAALTNGIAYVTNNADTTYQPISCAACHQPHDASYAEQLRVPSTSILLADGVTTVTNAGLGTICINCHRSRNGSVTNSIFSYPLGLQTWAGGNSFGPHDNPVSDIFYGVNGWTYGKNIPSAAHRNAITNACVGCHMQTVASTDPAFLLAGGHTMNMSYQTVSGGVTNTVDMVGACQQCHAGITTFNFPVQDYNGDGIIQGVQDEVQSLLNQLSQLMPGSAYQANPSNYTGDGVVKTSLSVKTNWPAQYLEGAYNWQLVNNDGSKGVHNAPYAVGLLKASISDLTGGSINGGLPQWWQIEYFGSPTAPNAAPNATPAGDGIPNWLKYALGINPTVPGLVLPNGVVWANTASTINGIGSTNSIEIFTAAEVAFTTQAGSTYQVQSISNLGGGWQNVGAPIHGDGNTKSYLTPTRNDQMQFFRVLVNTP